VKSGHLGVLAIWENRMSHRNGSEDALRGLTASIDALKVMLCDYFDDGATPSHEEIMEITSRIEQLQRLSVSLRGIAHDKGEVTQEKTPSETQTTTRGGGDFRKPPRPSDGAFDFLALEAVRVANAQKLPLRREHHIRVLKHYLPDLNESSIPPKLGGWKKDAILTWIDRKPHTVDLTPGGRGKMRELYGEAVDRKQQIEAAMSTHFTHGYSFPTRDELN
jgi:hypothetical protein